MWFKNRRAKSRQQPQQTKSRTPTGAATPSKVKPSKPSPASGSRQVPSTTGLPTSSTATSPSTINIKKEYPGMSHYRGVGESTSHGSNASSINETPSPPMAPGTSPIGYSNDYGGYSSNWSSSPHTPNTSPPAYYNQNYTPAYYTQMQPDYLNSQSAQNHMQVMNNMAMGGTYQMAGYGHMGMSPAHHQNFGTRHPSDCSLEFTNIA